MKYFLEKRSLGKNYYYVVKSASGKKLRELENSHEPLFDTRSEALAHAMSLKKGN